jgi:hypothetical protein
LRQGNGTCEIQRIGQRRQGRSKLRQRQRQHALDLRRIDGDGSAADPHADQLFGDEAAERVTDEHRRAVERRDDAFHVGDDVVDALIRDRARVGARCGNARWLFRPARRDGRVALGPEQIAPGRPARGMQPEPVNENDRNSGS